jgi:hypothetical protein
VRCKSLIKLSLSGATGKPKHLIVDQGPEFKCEHFENVWSKAWNILLRFGAVGKHGSIAVVERFHRTMKELLRQITVPEDQAAFERELRLLPYMPGDGEPERKNENPVSEFSGDAAQGGMAGSGQRPPPLTRHPPLTHHVFLLSLSPVAEKQFPILILQLQRCMLPVLPDGSSNDTWLSHHVIGFQREMPP